MIINPWKINMLTEILFSFFQNNKPDHMDNFIKNQIYFSNNEESLIEFLIQSLYFIPKSYTEFFDFCLRIAHQNFKHIRPRVMAKNLRLLYLVNFYFGYKES